MGIIKKGRDLVIFDIGTAVPIEPGDKLPVMPVVSDGAVIIIGGRAPTWQYGKAIASFLATDAGVIAVFDPRLDGAVIVASNAKYPFTVGEIIPYQW
jgi:CRISPR-associated Csx3 family protein